MAYPAQPSTFVLNTPLSLYFFEGDELLQTDGYSFLVALITTMADAARSVGYAIDLPQPVGTLTWDMRLLRAIQASARGLRAPAAYLEVVDADVAAGTISAGTVAVALWLAYRQQRLVGSNYVYGRGTPEGINILEGSTLPSMGTAIADSGNVSFGLQTSTVPRAAQPRPLPLRERSTAGSALLALGFVASLAIVAGLAMSTVPSRKNPSRRRRRVAKTA